MRTARGFTLIELMITVAIIAIIASVALPAYNDYVTRGKIQEATSALLAMRTKMEQYYQDQRSWAPPAPAIQPCQPGSVAPLPTGLKYFTITCNPAPTANTYTVRADGAGFTFTINEANARATINVPPGWAANANCWVSRKGGLC